MKKCYKCKAEIESEKISFREECPVCGSDLHVCLNCSFYDTGKANSCREDQADYVKEKEKANYCDYFRFTDLSAKQSARDEAEKLWASLTKKSN
ncbi:MAG TPA: hypothetical protein VMT62_06410 [Syntrophorhabdaceae bacterium]|nr:hypothetical protein [Syntrophorhabdaceae bacterium]